MGAQQARTDERLADPFGSGGTPATRYGQRGSRIGVPGRSLS